MVERKKYLADFIKDKETDLVNKYTNSQEKVPNAPNIVELFTNPTPPIRLQTVQGAKQEDIPVVRIHALWNEEVKDSEVSLSNDACILISGPTEDFYENLEALFAKPVDEGLVQLRARFFELFAHVEGTIIGTPSLDIKSKNTMQRLEL